MDRVESFTGRYRFLSNFWPSEVWCGAESYPTVEHAYQAAKTRDAAERARIRGALTPGAAKRLGRRVTLRKDWEQVKVEVMRECLRQKFKGPDLRDQLLATGNAELVEGNTWGDRYWGQDPVGTGENTLGRLLMQIRAELRDAKGGA